MRLGVLRRLLLIKFPPNWRYGSVHPFAGNRPPVDFIHLWDQGAEGDESTDDTAPVQGGFKKYGDGSKTVYVDAGPYIRKDTITVPKGARIVDETWSQFAVNVASSCTRRSPLQCSRRATRETSAQ